MYIFLAILLIMKGSATNKIVNEIYILKGK